MKEAPCVLRDSRREDELDRGIVRAEITRIGKKLIIYKNDYMDSMSIKEEKGRARDLVF